MSYFPKGVPPPCKNASSYSLPPFNAGRLSCCGARVEAPLPGSRSPDRHYHQQEDEFLYIISGKATVVEEDGAHPLGPSGTACWPTVDENAHQATIRPEELCAYLNLSSRTTPTDVTHYLAWKDTLDDFEDKNSAIFGFGNTLVNLLKTEATRELVEPTTRTAGREPRVTLCPRRACS